MPGSNRLAFSRELGPSRAAGGLRLSASLAWPSVNRCHHALPHRASGSDRKPPDQPVPPGPPWPMELTCCHASRRAAGWSQGQLGASVTRCQRALPRKRAQRGRMPADKPVPPGPPWPAHLTWQSTTTSTSIFKAAGRAPGPWRLGRELFAFADDLLTVFSGMLQSPLHACSKPATWPASM